MSCPDNPQENQVNVTDATDAIAKAKSHLRALVQTCSSARMTAFA